MDENVNCLTKSEKFFLHEIPENRNATLGMDGRSYRCCCCCEYIPFFLVKKVKYMRCAHSHSYQERLLLFLKNTNTQQNYSLNRMIALLISYRKLSVHNIKQLMPSTYLETIDLVSVNACIFFTYIVYMSHSAEQSAFSQ